MSQSIYKYELNLGITTIYVPKGYEVLTAQMQDDRLQVWIKIDSDVNPDQELLFEVIGTGHQLAVYSTPMKYVSTVQETNGLYVWHIFYHEVL